MSRGILNTKVICAMALAAMAGASSAMANSNVITYQGVLSDGGEAFSGNAQMLFSLWDAASGGSLVWGPENQGSVPVSNGSFAVLLGSVSPFGAVFENNSSLWLEVSADVGAGLQVFTPRVAFAAAPYALMATRAQSAAQADNATTADTATTALSANTATTADTATTALSANTATTADSATTADTATTALSANTATTADSATTADTATTALSANTATTADSATTADAATTAITAITANSVDWSGIQNVPGDLADGGDAATLNGLGAGAFAPVAHTHVASDITGGTFDIARIPVGSGGGQVAAGNHSHAAGAITSGVFDIARIPVGSNATQVAAGNHTHNSLNNADNTLTNRVFVNAAGNVGINTTTPGEALEVNGAMQFTGDSAIANQTTGLMSRAPRTVFSRASGFECTVGNGTLNSQSFTLTRSAVVSISAYSTRFSDNSTQYDMNLNVSGLGDVATARNWSAGGYHLTWSGVLAPGVYTVQLFVTGGGWDCPGDPRFGGISTLIFE